MDSHDYAASLGLDTTHPATIAALDPETYQLAMPPECMYGWLGDKARTLGGPLGWAYTGLLAVFASYGVQVQGDCDIRPTLYVAHLGDKGVGKSRIQDRITRAMRFHTDTVVTTVPGSDRGLYEMFAEEVPKNGGPAGPAPCRVLMQDEMLQLLAKVNIQGSALGSTLCTLWSKDEASGSVKNHLTKGRVRLSLLGAVKAKDAGEFQTAFQAKTTEGFADRFILVPGPPKWRWKSIWHANPELRIPTPVAVPVAISQALEEWTVAGDHITPSEDRGRIGEIALRVAVISASANQDTQVTMACLQAALKLAEWQMEVRKVYQPSVARNEQAVLSELALSALELLDNKTPGKFVSWRDVYKAHNWPRKFGQEAVNRCFNSLIAGDAVIYKTDSKDKPNGQIRINRN